jgi:hypothetical protein
MMNGEVNTPEGFVMPQLGEIVNGVASTYIAQNQGKSFRFETVRELNQMKSEQAGVELFDDVDVVIFFKDKYEACSLRCDRHTFSDHPYIIAEYNRWKAGQKSNVTDVRSWKAITEHELVMLLRSGFLTVEQVNGASDDQLMMLGLGWEDIKLKAARHMKSKEDKVDLSAYAEQLVQVKRDAEESRTERDALRAELEAIRRQLENKPRRGRPRKVDRGVVIEDEAA